MVQIRKRVFLCFSMVLFFISSNLFAQDVQFSKRVMTDQEFETLKQLVGVYEPGKDYNKIINGHGTGLKPPTAEQWQKMRNQPILVDDIEFTEVSQSTSVDNSATIWFPPIGDQSVEGSCVAWACGYYTKTFQEAREHNWDLSGATWQDGQPSESHQDKIFSPDFIYHQINDGMDMGAYYQDALNLLERIGCCTWKEMPYDPRDHTSWPSEQAWREAPWYRSKTGSAFMWVDTDEAIEDLKQWIASGDVVIISINANLYMTLTDDDLWTIDNYNGLATNHANTIVGYDDNFGPYEENGNPNAYGAFKVANSWGIGSSWEKIPDGFYYISYECMKQEVRRFYFYENRINYEPEMVASFQIDHDRRAECEITVGIGETSNPDSTKRFEDYDSRGGNHPFPTNNIVFDITEFKPFMSGSEDNFFLGIYDNGTTLGTIESFAIEMYDDYASGIPQQIYSSDDPPVTTVNSSNVYAQVSTGQANRFNISGAVSYDATGRTVPDVTLDLTNGEGNSSTISDASGNYSFTNIIAGSIDLVPSKTGDLQDAITGSDALLILQYLAFLANLTEEQAFAGDVTEDGSVTGSDAQAILRYLAFYSDNIGSTGKWRFDPADTSFALNANVGIDFKAYLLGDANLDWVSSSAPMNTSMEVSTVAEISLDLNQATVIQDKYIDIPVFLTTTRQELNTLLFSLDFDPTYLKYHSTQKTDLSQDFLMAANGTETGKIHIAMAAAHGIKTSGQVLRLKFEMINPLSRDHLAGFDFSRVVVNDQHAAGIIKGVVTFANSEDTAFPKRFDLSQNYPNPFNPETVIKYQLPYDVTVNLRIYDILGNEVITLVNKKQSAGQYSISWNGTDRLGNYVSAGIYFYRLEAGDFQAVRKMVLVR